MTVKGLFALAADYEREANLHRFDASIVGTQTWTLEMQSRMDAKRCRQKAYKMLGAVGVSDEQLTLSGGVI